MSFENDIERQPFYARVALLLVGWATAGVLLYALSTLLPGEAMVIIGFVGWVIVKLDRASSWRKSLASLLCGITCLLTSICAAALWATDWHWHGYVLARLTFVGVCLGAVLILLDRRADA